MAEAKAAGPQADADAQLVQYRSDGPIAILTLNDPPANTYSYEMMQALDRAVLAIRSSSK